jgi:malonyl-CoA/methylmalonyl-CoA synthetase
MQNNLYHTLMGERGGPHGARLAVREDSGREWTYDELDAASAALAGALRDAGVQAGERVVAQVGKSAQALALYLAALRLGATYLPLNPDYTAAEVQRYVQDAQPLLVIASRAALAALAALQDGAGPDAFRPPRQIALEADGSGELAGLAHAAAPYAQVAPVDGSAVAAILYTSGTTGRSKGAMLTHANLDFITRALTAQWEIQAADTLLHALPMFHAHGLFVAAGPLLHVKGRILLMSKFSADGVLDALPQATVFMGVPTLYNRLTASARLDRGLCSGMRLFTCGSAPLPVELFNEFQARSGHAILERYGLTETTIVSSNPLHGQRMAGTVGYALPGEQVRLRDAGGDGAGELEVKGPNVFAGYWRMPEQTAKEFTADGFFRTGDIARMSPDGRISIVGRSKEVIITGGYNVYPREVEEVLLKAPGVRDAAVVGVPHPDFGEGVIAVLECETGAQPPAEDALLQAAAGVLAKYKVPKKVFFTPALPRNAMGKVLKADLQKAYGAVFDV